MILSQCVRLKTGASGRNFYILKITINGLENKLVPHTLTIHAPYPPVPPTPTLRLLFFRLQGVYRHFLLLKKGCHLEGAVF